jgi:glycosyltransferase involved in cell wall biosynthesis
VVVPAHNEEILLPGCLAALRVTAAAVELPVHLLVVLDSCTDSTAEAAGQVSVLAVSARNVGAARRAGIAHLLRAIGAEGTWLACTDADSRVPPSWLSDQLSHACGGVDAVAGMVSVVDWTGHLASTAERFRHLHQRIVGHSHVHGANIGVSAQAYLAAGGFPSQAAHEDVALIAALTRGGHHVMHTADPPVITSARRHSRAPAGFARFLIQLADPDPIT